MKLSGDYILRDVAGETVLIPVGEAAIQNSGLGVVNQTGARIIELLKNETSTDEIVTEIMKDFDANEDICLRDVEEFLENLRYLGLLSK